MNNATHMYPPVDGRGYISVPFPEQLSEPSPTSEKDAIKAEDLGDDGRMSSSAVLAVVALASVYVSTNIANFFNGVTVLYIKSDLNIDESMSEWLLTIPSLIFACTAPIIGYLSDMYGRRNALILGMTAHCIGNVVTAAASNFGMALAGFAIGSFGDAIAELAGVAAIAELVPIRKRGLFLAVTTLMTLPFAPSVLYAELISLHSSWRWCYVLVIIWSTLSFIALGLTYFRLQLVQPSHESRHTTYKQIDYLGIVLLVAGSVLLIVGLQAGGSGDVSWTSAYTLGSLIAGVVLLVLLLLWEWKGAKAPLIPFRLFKGQRVVGLAFGTIFISGMYYTAAANIGPYVFTKVFAASPLEVGLMALGPSFGIFLGATGFNILLGYSCGAARELLTCSALLMAGFGGALAIIKPESLTLYLVLASLTSIGIGGLLEPTATVATFGCPQDLIGTVVSLTAFLRTIGGTFGFSIFSTISKAAGYQALPPLVGLYAVKAGLKETLVYRFVQSFTQQINANSPGMPASSATVNLPGVTQEIIDAAALGSQYGYSVAFRAMFYAQIAFGVIAVLLCVALPNISSLLTNQIVVRAK